ncbi:AAA family ATPase [Dehalococcoides mccartyi]|uniref:ORC1/DEAH AAA+ ATPase domain-containing protein n=1 Tax=Dehalococcoides mccartyi TaxID=61435 RepID=A0A2J1E0E0_9CHLR|nr:AAA family ATPase [Dehalococcoides mccartyi]PKH47944.1 hypothetical protein CVH13_00132 [Dehalococcoides mccartyi]BAS31156.1 hypothetical protein IBK_0081 [Dehalococcoides mccartyi IBARAKI]
MNLSNMTNPYDWHIPVKDNKLFSGRKHEKQIIFDELECLKSRPNKNPLIVLKGERRVGKTSLINYICNDDSTNDIFFIDIRIYELITPIIFWKEVFYRIISKLNDLGIKVDRGGDTKTNSIGYQLNSENTSRPCYLECPSIFGNGEISNFYLQSDINEVLSAIQNKGYKALVLIIDEAQHLNNSSDIQSQLRDIRDNVRHIGLILAGTHDIASLFSNSSLPLYGQQTSLEIKNYTNIEEICACAILPLSKDEQILMSPVTINYLAKLSQGKPSHIRLICNAIYERYRKNLQTDLNITKEALFEILEIIKSQEEDKGTYNIIRSIEKLDTVNLELLYNMTRFPNWTLNDIVSLDESFRGEAYSEAASRRRFDFINNKKQIFISDGILENDEERCILNGGEFVNLFLRFHIELKRYGKLLKKVHLNGIVPTPFSEKCIKLLNSLCYILGDNPEIGYSIFHTFFQDQEGDLIQKVKDRYHFISDLISGKAMENDEHSRSIFSECANIANLVERQGKYCLYCISIRNLDNSFELIQTEMYFNQSDPVNINLQDLNPTAWENIKKQAEIAHIVIEDTACFEVDLLNLESLLKYVGLELNQVLSKGNDIQKWTVLALQHAVKSVEKDNFNTTEYEKQIMQNPSWVPYYSKHNMEDALIDIDNCLNKIESRAVKARLFNDRGYIRYSMSDGYNKSQAIRDLELAINYHFIDFGLSLLNVAYIYLDKNNYDDAIDYCQLALMLSNMRHNIIAGYLRYRLLVPPSGFGFIPKIEMTPANTIEIAYLNMAFAYTHSDRIALAYTCLNEGLEVIPSSFYLKHGLARLYLFDMKAPEAKKIYQELRNMTCPSPYFVDELKRMTKGYHRFRK